MNDDFVESKMVAHIIFHYPLPLPTSLSSGSKVRPIKMLQAFRAMGYTVHVISGGSEERTRSFQHIQELAASGTDFAFLYCELPGPPLLWLNRQERNRFIDFRVLVWCRKNKIPIGLFYRDVHWRFNSIFKTAVAQPKRSIVRSLFRVEWVAIQRLVQHLFLPSREMARYLPTTWPEDQFYALPPGTENPDPDNISHRGASENISSGGATVNEIEQRKLNLFYVGGITPPLYDLLPFIQAVQQLHFVNLTICCREAEWNQSKDYYKCIHKSHQVQIVHVEGESLNQYYQLADIFSMVLAAHPYLTFAMPVKIFESLGHTVPLLVSSETTVVARFVEAEQIGWVTTTQEEICEQLEFLHRNRHIIEEKRSHIEIVRKKHTWQSRAKKVAHVLSATYDSRSA